MNKEIDFSNLGIPNEQIEKINKHLSNAKKYVFEKDPGMEEGFAWLKNQLEALPANYGSILYKIALNNKPNSEVSYIEEGYDSCQSHRKISKVIGESLLLGGLVYEFGLLGKKIDIEEAKTIVKSNLVIEGDQTKALPEIAKKYGAKQDFLFPGVTPTNKGTPSLEEYAYLALSGKPMTSVRSLLGVGGIRFDKDWNYATDFSTFVNLKIEEDKRYYPGIGIYFALLNLDKSSIPALSNEVLDSLAQSIKSVKEKKFQGVSVLCSAFIPVWSELKNYQYGSSYDTLELAESFHSPAYDFAGLLRIVEKLNKDGHLDSSDITQIGKLKTKLGNIWSFNSTIHLPWTAELAGLSNDLIGSITNETGDWAVRYGVGWSGKSLEVREFHFGQKRKFPVDLGGKIAYSLIFYPESSTFEGKVEVTDLIPASPFWTEIKKNGFIAAVLEKIKWLKTK